MGINELLKDAAVAAALATGNITDEAKKTAVLNEAIAQIGDSFETLDDDSKKASVIALIPAIVTKFQATGDDNTEIKHGAKKGGVNQEQASNAAAKIMASADIQTNQASIHISGILASKPAAASRFAGTTTMTVKKPSESTKKKFKSYKDNMAPDKALGAKDWRLINTEANLKAYDDAKALLDSAESGSVTTDVYVAENSTPVILGYEFTDNTGKKSYLSKKKEILRAYLAVMFGGKVPVNETSKLGAYLRAYTPKRGDNAGVTTTNVVIVGAKDYWASNSEGVVTYVVDANAKEDLSVRSALSLEVENGDGKKRPVRLYGTISVPRVDKKTEFKQVFGEMSSGAVGTQNAEVKDVSIEVLTGAISGVQESEIAKFSPDAAKAFAAALQNSSSVAND